MSLGERLRLLPLLVYRRLVLAMGRETIVGYDEVIVVLRETLLSPYLLPLERLCVLHSIWQLDSSVEPPWLQAVTWSASISLIL